MLSFVTFSLFVICSFAQLQYGGSIIKKSQSSQRIKQGQLFIDTNSFDEGNLVVAVCAVDNSSSIKNCIVVQNQMFPDNERNRSCVTLLKGDCEDSRLTSRVGATPLGRDKAILYWGDNYNNSTIIKIGILNFETCKMDRIHTIPDPEREVLLDLFYTRKLVKYDDNSFDLFFNDSTVCKDNLCVMSIKKDGSVKSQLMVSKLLGSGFVLSISTIATRSPTKGYAYLKRTDLSYSFLLVKPDSTTKQLDKYDSTASPTVSAGNNFMGACYKADADSDVACTQYNEDGNVKFKTIIPEEYKNSRSRAVYNLHDGGMLVILAEMTNCDQLSNCDETNYHMVKIASDGKLMGTIRTRDFDNVTSQWKFVGIYKFGDSLYCSVLIAEDPLDDENKLNNYQFLHHCVTDDEFIV